MIRRGPADVEAMRSRFALPVPVLAGALCAAGALGAGSLFPPPGDDSVVYGALARNLLDGRGFAISAEHPASPTASRSPGYPIFLAGLFRVFGEGAAPLLMVQAGVFGLGMGMLAHAALTTFDPRVVLGAALLLASNPYVGRWSGARLSECVYLALVAMCIAALVAALRSGRAGLFGLTGALWAAATLTRPLTLVLLPGLLACIALYRPRVLRPWRAVGVVCAAGLLVWAPWPLRNWAVFHRFIPLQTRATGFNLWLTTLPGEDQPRASYYTLPAVWYERYPEIRALMASRTDSLAEMDAERELAGVAAARIAQAPGRYALSRVIALPRLWLHSGRLWLSDVSFAAALRDRRYDLVAAKAGLALWMSVLPLLLALWGLASEAHRWRAVLPFAIFPVTLLLAHLPFWIEDRYGLPAWPFLMLFAARGLAAMTLRPGGRADEGPPLVLRRAAS
jgi:4-amino-4-deoxy-L-arabinose transferase-like glycosyltransferase